MSLFNFIYDKKLFDEALQRFKDNPLNDGIEMLYKEEDDSENEGEFV